MNRGSLVMNEKERRRLEVLSRVKREEISLVEAAQILDLSYRQTKRVYKRLREEGDSGLVHKQRGKPSNRQISPTVKKNVLNRYQERYEGFGPTLASEKLKEEGYEIHPETLRRWLIKNGDWQKKKAKKAIRQRRLRRPHFGELVQLDGSDHFWFGENFPSCVLMNMVDDATNTNFSLLAKNESTYSAMAVLKGWIERYGLPKALYTDRHSAYYSTDNRLSLFARACRELDIEIIYARSPQAKGRVERWNGIYQDRLVKEMRLRQITDRNVANDWIHKEFVDSLNAKFSLSPRSVVDFHRSAPDKNELERIFSYKGERKLSSDYTIRWNNRVFQLSETKIHPGQSLSIHENETKSVSVFLGKEKLTTSELNVDVRKSLCLKDHVKELSKSSKNKQKLYLQIKKFKKEGMSNTAISRHLSISRGTVINYLQKGVPENSRSARKTLMQPFESEIQDWLEKYPKLSAIEILRRIQSRGYQGSYSTCKSHIQKLKQFKNIAN